MAAHLFFFNSMFHLCRDCFHHGVCCLKRRCIFSPYIPIQPCSHLSITFNLSSSSILASSRSALILDLGVIFNWDWGKPRNTAFDVFYSDTDDQTKNQPPKLIGLSQTLETTNKTHLLSSASLIRRSARLFATRAFSSSLSWKAWMLIVALTPTIFSNWASIFHWQGHLDKFNMLFLLLLSLKLSCRPCVAGLEVILVQKIAQGCHPIGVDEYSTFVISIYLLS